MQGKEQAETFRIIKEFYGVSEEIIEYVDNNMDYSDYVDVLDKLDIVQCLILKMSDFSEFISERCREVEDDEYLSNEQKKELEEKIIEIVFSLNKCHKLLQNKLKNSNK